MKKLLEILVLSLLLVGCVNQSENNRIRKKNAEIFKYNATALLNKKQSRWSVGTWFGFYNRGAYHGFGNTPQQASDNAAKLCEEKRKKKFTNQTLYCLEPIIYYGRKHVGTISELKVEKIEKIENKKKIRKIDAPKDPS